MRFLAAQPFAIFRIMEGDPPHVPAPWSFIVLSALAGMLFARVGGVAALNRKIVPPWTSFRDITDALFTARTAHVNTVVESTSAQRGTVERLHVWRPLIVVMAGDNARDPYKD